MTDETQTRQNVIGHRWSEVLSTASCLQCCHQRQHLLPAACQHLQRADVHVLCLENMSHIQHWASSGLQTASLDVAVARQNVQRLDAVQILPEFVRVAWEPALWQCCLIMLYQWPHHPGPDHHGPDHPGSHHSGPDHPGPDHPAHLLITHHHQQTVIPLLTNQSGLNHLQRRHVSFLYCSTIYNSNRHSRMMSWCNLKNAYKNEWRFYLCVIKN